MRDLDAVEEALHQSIVAVSQTSREKGPGE
jgi:hypothetical protein